MLRVFTLHLPEGFLRHGTMSIPTLTVMAVATDLHRTFLIPDSLAGGGCALSARRTVFIAFALSLFATLLLYCKCGGLSSGRNLDTPRCFVYNEISEGVKVVAKRRWIVIAVAVLLLASAVLTFFYLTRGEFFEADGLRQREGITIENAYVEDGVLYYTLVNRTHKNVSFWYSSPAMIAKKTADGWESPNGVNLYYQQQQGWDLNRFSKIECKVELEGEELRSGEYRILHSCEGDWREGRFLAVGYYTIPSM